MRSASRSGVVFKRPFEIHPFPFMANPLPEGEQPVLRIVPMPADTNAHGTIFGGWVMSQVDIAGSIVAWDRALGPVVTVAVNSFVFREPVFVGDLVSFYARVIKVGRTSITTDVEVFSRTGAGRAAAKR